MNISRISAIFAAGSLFAYYPGITAPYSLPKLAVLAVGLVIMSLMVAGGAPVNMGHPLVPVGASFLFVCLISAVFADDKWLAFAGNHNSYSLGLMGLSTAFFYYISAASGPDNKIIPIAAAIIGVHAFAQCAGIDASVSSQLTGNRAIGTIGSPVFLGMILGIALPLAMSESWVYALAVCLGLLATKSRGAWLAAIIGLVVYGASKRKFIPVIVALIVFFTSFMIYGRRSYVRSDIERMETWRVAIKTAVDNPIIGIGPDGFGNAYRLRRSEAAGSHIAEDAHNDFLQVASTLGLVGLIAYTILFTAVFLVVAGPAMGAVAAAFVNAKVNPMPLEVIVFLSVIVGLYSVCSGTSKPLPKWARMSFLIFSMSILVVVSRMVAADYYAAIGSVPSLEIATKLNPFELSYKASLVNRGITELKSPGKWEWHQSVLSVMSEQAKSAVFLRPAASTSWHIAGLVAKIERKLGGNSDPRPHIAKAIALSPRDKQLLEMTR